MAEKPDDFITQIESFNPPELENYLKTNENIRLIKQELDKLVKELKIAAKVGNFDGFYDRESPQLISKIQIKKLELISLIDYEKGKEVGNEIKAQTIQTQFSIVNEIKPISGVGIAPKFEENKVTPPFAFRNIMAYAEEKFYLTAVIGFFMIGLQLVANLIYVSKVKSNIQTNVVAPLEQRLNVAETEKEELNKNIANLQKQIVFLQNVSLRPPVLSRPKTNTNISKTSSNRNASKNQSRKPASSKYSRN